MKFIFGSGAITVLGPCFCSFQMCAAAVGYPVCCCCPFILQLVILLPCTPVIWLFFPSYTPTPRLLLRYLPEVIVTGLLKTYCVLAPVRVLCPCGTTGNRGTAGRPWASLASALFVFSLSEHSKWCLLSLEGSWYVYSWLCCVHQALGRGRDPTVVVLPVRMLLSVSDWFRLAEAQRVEGVATS